MNQPMLRDFFQLGPEFKFQNHPNLSDIGEILGFGKFDRRSLKDLSSLTHVWRKGYTCIDGTPGTSLVDWQSSSVQQELKTMTLQFLDGAGYGLRLWPHTEDERDLYYIKDREKISKLMAVFFWRQNDMSSTNNRYRLIRMGQSTAVHVAGRKTHISAVREEEHRSALLHDAQAQSHDEFQDSAFTRHSPAVPILDKSQPPKIQHGASAVGNFYALPELQIEGQHPLPKDEEKSSHHVPLNVRWGRRLSGSLKPPFESIDLCYSDSDDGSIADPSKIVILRGRFPEPTERSRINARSPTTTSGSQIDMERLSRVSDPCFPQLHSLDHNLGDVREDSIRAVAYNVGFGDKVQVDNHEGEARDDGDRDGEPENGHGEEQPRDDLEDNARSDGQEGMGNDDQEEKGDGDQDQKVDDGEEDVGNDDEENVGDDGQEEMADDDLEDTDADRQSTDNDDGQRDGDDETRQVTASYNGSEASYRTVRRSSRPKKPRCSILDESSNEDEPKKVDEDEYFQTPESDKVHYKRRNAGAGRTAPKMKEHRICKPRKGGKQGRGKRGVRKPTGPSRSSAAGRRQTIGKDSLEADERAHDPLESELSSPTPPYSAGPFSELGRQRDPIGSPQVVETNVRRARSSSRGRKRIVNVSFFIVKRRAPILATQRWPQGRLKGKSADFVFEAASSITQKEFDEVECTLYTSRREHTEVLRRDDEEGFTKMEKFFGEEMNKAFDQNRNEWKDFMIEIEPKFHRELDMRGNEEIEEAVMGDW